MLPLVLIGCSSSEPLTPQAVVERFEQDEASLHQEISALPDPLERQVLVMALAESFPGDTLAFCALLEGRPMRRCEAINNRPHLSEGKRPPEPLAELMVGWQSPWRDLTGVGSRVDALSRAKEAASTDEAAAACMAQPEGLYRDECFFQAAEARMEVQLCLGAGGFAANCLGHLARRTADLAPPSDSPDWVAFHQQLDQHQLSGFLALAYEDRVYALALRSSTARAGSPGGHALDHLQGGHRHLACGLALRLVEEQPEAGLAELKALLEARPQPSPARPDPGFALKPQLRELEVAEGQDWTFLWDNAKRPWLEGDADLELCLELARVQLGQK